MTRLLFLILIPVGLVPFRLLVMAAVPIEVPIVILGDLFLAIASRYRRPS